ncbi:UNVERIFIED_CONTAM: hypothetical protein NCL1_04924 [Trichonephila clavipes]
MVASSLAAGGIAAGGPVALVTSAGAECHESWRRNRREPWCRGHAIPAGSLCRRRADHRGDGGLLRVDRLCRANDAASGADACRGRQCLRAARIGAGRRGVPDRG